MQQDKAKDDRLYRMRHSAAHIMAEAVLEMFPDAKLGIGPPIDSGFYYDIRDLSHSMKELLDELKKHPGKVPVTIKLF